MWNIPEGPKPVHFLRWPPFIGYTKAPWQSLISCLKNNKQIVRPESSHGHPLDCQDIRPPELPPTIWDNPRSVGGVWDGSECCHYTLYRTLTLHLSDPGPVWLGPVEGIVYYNTPSSPLDVVFIKKILYPARCVWLIIWKDEGKTTTK